MSGDLDLDAFNASIAAMRDENPERALLLSDKTPATRSFALSLMFDLADVVKATMTSRFAKMEARIAALEEEATRP
jgi:esterase/lipase superfamily enzyme